MAEFPDLSKQVERAVSESLDSRLSGLHEEIVQKVLEALSPAFQQLSDEAAKSAAQAPPHQPAKSDSTDVLSAAVNSIHDGLSQSEILGALLDGVAHFASRAALCVVRGASVSVWKSRGFADEAALKTFSADVSHGLIARAIQAHTPVSAAAAEFDPDFVSIHGNPADGNASVLPLVVREKVPALLYTDAGTEPGGTFDSSALHVLVKTASIWLELVALRKASLSADASTPVAEAAAPAPVMAAAMAAPATTLTTIPVVSTPPPPPPAEPAEDLAHAVPSASPTSDDRLTELSPADQEAHKKAKRFAKLLVDEIKLYNKDKVAEGKQNKNLFSVLKEDIEKSRSTYEKRYGSTAAADARYFDSELVRVLADNDISLLGNEYQQ